MDRDPILDTKWLTVAEAATIMRVDKMTAYRLVNSGELPSARFGKGIRIPEQAMVDYLKSKMGHRG